MKNTRFIKIWQQRFIGLALILISVLATYINYIPEIDSYDGTILLITIPMGLYMFCTTKLIIE